VIELDIGPASAHRIRFRLSPLDELLQAMQVVLGLRAHPVRDVPALAGTAAVAASLEELVAVVSDPSYLCEFLSPPPEHGEVTAAEQLEQVRRADPDRVALELGLSAHAAHLAANPAGARDTLADQLEYAWHEVFAPVWPQVRQILVADVAHRSEQLAAHGLAVMLADLGPRIRVVGEPHEPVLAIRSSARLRAHLDARGLVLMPSVFIWPHVGVVTPGPWQPGVLYPARGSAALWASAPSSDTTHEALARLLGRTRARVLAAVATPATTSEVAATLGLAPSTVSEHLTVLREAGLLRSARRRHGVVHEHSDLGAGLLDGRLDGLGTRRALPDST
jgi:DNA-binding transcriptional ArsR family regulator